MTAPASQKPAPGERARDDDPAAAWVAGALRELREQGYRAGGARSAVIELLAEQGGCMDADDVAGRLRARGRRVGTASVYRALGLLTELDLVHKVALPGSPARFELVLPGGEHHHHLVCDQCGRTFPFSDEDLERAVSAISERASFRVEAHDVTLHGVCERCQDR